MRERGQNGNQLPAPAGSFWGGDFSTGEMGNFQPALTGLLLWRMSVAILPGRISLLARREDWSEVRRLHQNCFPTYTIIRTAFNVISAFGTLALVSGTILIATSK
jgi:hypothetical protein